MPKRKKKIKIRIPPYRLRRNDWRREIHQIACVEGKKQGVSYSEKDKIELNVTLYFSSSKILFHDVDNRLKDVMDALQGRLGGENRKKAFNAIIPNDSQIYRISAEKKLHPGQSHGFGHVIIRKYRER